MSAIVENVQEHPELAQNLFERMEHTTKQKLKKRSEEKVNKLSDPPLSETKTSAKASDDSSMKEGRSHFLNKKKT